MPLYARLLYWYKPPISARYRHVLYCSYQTKYDDFVSTPMLIGTSISVAGFLNHFVSARWSTAKSLRNNSRHGSHSFSQAFRFCLRVIRKALICTLIATTSLFKMQSLATLQRSHGLAEAGSVPLTWRAKNTRQTPTSIHSSIYICILRRMHGFA